MDKEEHRKLAVAILPHLDAIHKIIGPTARISFVAVVESSTGGETTDIIMGNGDFLESAYVLLRSEMGNRTESVINVKAPNDNTRH